MKESNFTFGTYEKVDKIGHNYIIYCYSCNMFHLYYETLSLNLSLNEIFTLLDILQYYILKYSDLYDHDKRWIEINTAEQNVRFYFSINDCKTLSDLFSSTITYSHKKQMQASLN